MTRKLKVTGLVLVAMLAMSSLVASSATATLPDTDKVVTESAPFRLTSSQENGLSKFTLAGQAVECTTVSINATVNALEVTEVLTEVPTYAGCTYAGQAATVTMNGCKYRITGTTGTDGDARSHLTCEGTNKMVLTLNAIACEVFVASQEAEGGFTITTVGTGTTRELTLHLTAKVKVSSKGDASEGVTCASLTNNSGTLEGTFAYTAERTESQIHVGVIDSTIATP
jgi:hypothetical protein